MRTRKYKKARTPRRMFLVICEGETEEAYVNLLKRHYRLPITIKTKVAGNSISSRLVAQYLKELDVTPEECSVIYVYDADVRLVLEKILSLPGTVIASNPCIELWFTLHIKDYSSPLSSEETVKKLYQAHPLWKSYAKANLTPDQGRHLIDNMRVAALRAQKLKWPLNPSSNMYEFLSMLEKELR